MNIASAAQSLESVGTDMQGIGLAVIGLAVIALSIAWIKATFF